MSTKDGLDWAGLMRAGLFGLKLRPKDFWDLTPIELMMMLGREGGQVPISRAQFEELSQAFPDNPAPGSVTGGGDERKK